MQKVKKAIYDPCCGTKVIGNVLRRSSFGHIPIIETDLYTIPDANIDFLKADNNDIRECCSCIMTNPPYGNNNKTKFLKKCYEIGLPFMLLLPVQSLNTPARISMFQNFGITIMYLSPDPRFFSAETEKEISVGGMAWFCWDGKCLPNQISFIYGIKESVQNKINQITIPQLEKITINDIMNDDDNDEESVFQFSESKVNNQMEVRQGSLQLGTYWNDTVEN